MVIKSLTITEDAYDALKRLKHGDESFSEVILKVTSDRTDVIKRYLGAAGVNEKEADAWKARLSERRKTVDNEATTRQSRFARVRGTVSGNP